MFDAAVFAQSWIDAWNALDVGAVVSHYADACEFVSPKAALVTGDSVIRGRPALRAYWQRAVERFPGLHFALVHASWDAASRTLVIVYEASLDAPPVRACEVLRFGADDRIVHGEAFYGAGANA